MSSLEQAFEVRFRINGYVKVAHIFARDHVRAEKRAEKFPHVIWVRKVDPYRVAGNLDCDKLFKEVGEVDRVVGNPYKSAIAMDEMIWEKRINRRNNLGKDKETIDNNRNI